MNDKREHFRKLEYLSLYNLAIHYLRKTCTEIRLMENHWHPFDMIMFSGGSRVLVEHKNRLDKSLSNYYTEGATIEKKKFDALKELSSRDGSKLFYVNQWNQDCLILIWDFTDINPTTLKEGIQRCPSDSYTDSGWEMKPVYYLPFQKADFILRLSTYERIGNETFIAEIQAKQEAGRQLLRDVFAAHNNIDIEI